MRKLIPLNNPKIRAMHPREFWTCFDSFEYADLLMGLDKYTKLFLFEMLITMNQDNTIDPCESTLGRKQNKKAREILESLNLIGKVDFGHRSSWALNPYIFKKRNEIDSRITEYFENHLPFPEKWKEI